jgi:hypothetical protein
MQCLFPVLSLSCMEAVFCHHCFTPPSRGPFRLCRRVDWILRDRGMATTQVPEGLGGHYLWRLSANVLNMTSEIAGEG